MISNRTLLEIVIVAWIIVAALYLIRTPIDHRTHDFWWHLEYTEIIVKEHRMPKPNENQETTHPPLYYLINSLIAPESIKLNKKVIHVNYVRALSVLYGAISLLIIAWILGEITKNSIHKLLVLLFIATTPKFVYVFSTYNNDSLATILSLAIIAVSYRLYLKWSSKFAVLLFLLGAVGFYTKYSVVLCMAIISLVIFCCNFIKGELPSKFAQNIVLIFILSIIPYIPWMVFHNYYHTKQFMPNTIGHWSYKNPGLSVMKNTLSTIIKIPLLHKVEHEWDEPWVFVDPKDPRSKRVDYLATVFINSIIGEYIYSKPHVLFFWLLLWIHLIAYLVSLTNFFKSDLTKLSTLCIFLTHLAILIVLSRMIPPIWSCAMDFRFISWTWIAWSILYVSVLADENKWFAKFGTLLYGIGILLQVYVLLVVEGGIQQ